MKPEESRMSKKECFRQARKSCLKDWKRKTKLMTSGQEARRV